MRSILGAKSWAALTKLQESLSDEEKAQITIYCQKKNGLQELINYINDKLLDKTPEGETYYQFKEEDAEALKNFFTTFTDDLNQFRVGKKFYEDMQDNIANLSAKDLTRLQESKAQVPGYRLFFYGKRLLAFPFTVLFNTIFAIKNLITTDQTPYTEWRIFKDSNDEPLYKVDARENFHEKLRELGIFVNADKLDDAMLLIPDAEDNGVASKIRNAFGYAKGIFLPDARKMQTNWQKGIYIFFLLAFLVLLIAFPHIIAPLLALIPLIGSYISGFVLSTSLLAIFSKITFAFTLTKLPILLCNFVADLFVKNSDDTRPQQKIPRTQTTQIREVDKPPQSSHKVLNNALPSQSPSSPLSSTPPTRTTYSGSHTARSSSSRSSDEDEHKNPSPSSPSH